MEIYCQVTPYGLVPMYDSDYEEKQHLEQGERVLCTIRRPRNYEFHKKFFALLRMTIDHTPHRIQENLNIYNEEDLLDLLKVELGYFRTIRHGNTEIIKTGSISFSSMDEREFERFYNRALDIITRHYLPSVGRENIAEEISRYR